MRLSEDERSWGALARLAYFSGKMGDPAGADRLYREAQDELTAKEMRSYAWLEVQRGFLDFAHGRYPEARSHYDRADGLSGYWLVDEYMAELLAAEGRCAEAIAMFERLVAAVRRPDLEQAIGELYQLAGKTAARHWRQRALAAYLKSAATRRGALLAPPCRLLCRCRAKTARRRSVWARKDLQLRENFSTQAALAWALLPRRPI